MNEIRRAKLFDADGSQAIEVPLGFELPGQEVEVTKDGDRLIVKAVHGSTNWLDAVHLTPPLTKDEWPDIGDDDLPPPRDIQI